MLSLLMFTALLSTPTSRPADLNSLSVQELRVIVLQLQAENAKLVLNQA